LADRKITPYNRFFAKHRKAGLSASAIGKLWRGGAKATRSVRKTAGKKVRNYTARGKAILGRYGATGLVEDAAIGYFGSQVLMGMGYPLESALPMARVVQGAAGKALNRRGKDRLAYGLIDLVDVYLIRQGFKLPQTLGGISLTQMR